MKRCPTCRRVYADESLNFCRHDGSPLHDEPTGSLGGDATLTFGAAPGTGELEPTRILDAGTAHAGPVTTSPLPAAAPRRAPSRRAVDSLAVLPFVNEGEEPELEYLSDGIAESVINTLSQLPRLRVVSRSTVFRFKGRDVDPREVGARLGVRAVLTGRVRQVGETLTVGAELVDVTNDHQLWGERYNVAVADLLAVQEEIAQEISGKLRLRLSGKQKQRLARRYTEDTGAYQEYLKGRYQLNRRTEDSIRRAIAHFERAIEIDPTYALAHAGLAETYCLVAVYSVLPPREVMPRAQAAAERALEIDDALSDAHLALGFLKCRFEYKWSAGEREFRRALRLNPNSALARHWYAVLYLLPKGRFEDGVAYMERAEDLDPLSLPVNRDTALLLYFSRRYDEAVEKYHKILELEPNYPTARIWLGWCYEMMGRFDDAAAEFREVIDASGDDPLALASLAHTRAVAGRPDEARAVLDRLRELSARRHVPAYWVGAVHVALGEADRAFESFDRAYRERDFWLPIIAHADPRLVSIHHDPRFKDLVRRIRLSR